MAEKDPAPENKPTPGSDYDPAPLILLARAIVARRAVVYVGAGASLPSGAPLWADLLSWLYKEGAQPLLKQDKKSSTYLEERLGKERMFLESADLLQDILDKDLSSFLREKFAGVATPSSIHLNIGRIPFTAAITTNYDNLLEEGYEKAISGQERPPVATWNEPLAILQFIQENARFVLKTHGGFDNPTSLILSSRQYRELINGNPLYWHILKWIFMTKTCFFVGCSLTDSDLLQLFGEVMTEMGQASFGPHYALLPAKESPRIKIDNLLNQWRIKVIPLHNPNETTQQGKNTFDTQSEKNDKQDKEKQDKDSQDNGQQDKNDMSWVEAAVSEVLVGLAGEVAKQTVATQPPRVPISDDQDFFLDQALEKLLQSALEVTGSYRGDICLDDNFEKRLSADEAEKTPAGLRFRISRPADPEREKQVVERRSVCGIAYYESAPGIGVNIRDVKHPDLDQGSDVWHWGEIHCVPGHTEIRSELAMPILAEGVRVGVLNLESRLQRAYAAGHVTAAHWYSEKAGRLYRAAEARNWRGRKLHPSVTMKFQKSFLDLLKTLWRLHHKDHEPAQRLDELAESLDCLIFCADYITGTLQAPLAPEDPSQNGRVTFKFDEKPVLTGDVFRERSGIICRDAQQAIENGLIAKRYADQLELSGPLIGFPIYIQGYTAGVLFCWRRKGESGHLDWRDMEMFRRASHLIANASGKDFMLKPLRDPTRSSGDLGSQDEGEKKRRVHLSEQHIEGAKETIQFCVSDPVVKELSTVEGETNLALYAAWQRLAPQIASLLALLWIRYGAYEKDWMVPTRARLWVARRKIEDGKSGDDKSKASNPSPLVFGMVMEISLEKKSLEAAREKFLGNKWPNGDDAAHQGFWALCAQGATIRNLPLSEKEPLNEKVPTFLISEPEPSQAKKNGAMAEGISVNDFIPGDMSPISKEEEFNINKLPVRDRDLSFLLSRQSADLFTRFQKPGPEGDALAWLKGGYENTPIYAAPIIMVRDQKESQLNQPAGKLDLLVLEKKLPRTQLREPIGILALDVLVAKTKSKGEKIHKELELPTDESHITLQRELLHTVDLITACLAETAEFRNIGTRSKYHVASPREVVAAKRATNAGS
jgi:GAF domain-containing protein